MADENVYVETALARAWMYRFLGGIYLTEVDEKMLQDLKRLSFPEEEEGCSAATDNLFAGYKIMKNYIADAKAEDLEDLAAEYAKIFLSAGEASGIAAFPYESVYTDATRQVGGSTGMQMHALLLERGLKADPDKFRVFDDHVGLEFEYMAVLCEELAEFLAEGNTKKIKSNIREQRKYHMKHIMNWVPIFASDILKYTSSDFYRGAARMTNGFLMQEEELLDKGAAEWGI